MSQPENIGDVIETRRRSRSKTPLISLRVSADRENGSESPAGRKVRKAPTVTMIDESEEQSSPQKPPVPSQTRSTAVRKTRVITSDYSSDDISPDRVRQAAATVVANVANMQLLANMQQQPKAPSGQLSQSAVTTTTTTQTSTTYESKTVVIDGGRQTQQKLTVADKTTNNSNTSSGVKESVTAKLVAAMASPKKANASSSSVSTKQSKTQHEDVVVVASNKRETTASTTKVSATGGSVRIIHSTPKNITTSTVSSPKAVLTPEELKQHAAYKEYLEAGEYWNKFPKTDYTYSELSPHRREVAPGLVAMPNMSRPSLNKHAERVQTMIQRDPAQEAFIRQRYTSSRSGGYFGKSDAYDSSEEVDAYLDRAAALRQQRMTTEQHSSIVSRFFLSIVTFGFTCYDTVRSVFRRRDDEQHHYYTRIEDERGFFARAYGFVLSTLINIFKRIYLLISSVLFLDAFLLQTSAGKNVEQERAAQRKRRFLLFLLLLLPFLVIGGTLFYLDPSILDTIRASLPSSLRNFEFKIPNCLKTLAKPEMPALPDVDTVKQYVGDRWTDLSDLSGQYLDQLKLVTQNSADAIRQLWEGGAEQESNA